MTNEEKFIELGKPIQYGLEVWKALNAYAEAKAQYIHHVMTGGINCRLCMQGVKCDCSLFPCTSYTRRMLEISNKLEG